MAGTRVQFKGENEDNSEDGFQSEDSEIDTDEELQIAFEKKELKPGLNILLPVREKQIINNVEALKQRLSDFELRLPWFQRLDMVNLPAPLAPELMPHLGGDAEALAEDDFKREVVFYRQGQAAVLEAIPKLIAMGIRTKRPDDYFAQMAKTDEHMQKVRQSLLGQKLAIERREKAKKLREMRKFGKSVQQEALDKKTKEKREFLAATKKLRKGQSDKFDSLNEDAAAKKGKGKKIGKPDLRGVTHKSMREFRDKKYGFGGQKKNTKFNDAESYADVFKHSGKGKGKSSKMQGKSGKKGPFKGKRKGGRKK